MSRHRRTTRRRGTPCYVCLTRALADGAPPWGVAFAVDSHRGVEHALVVEDDDGVHGVQVASPDEGGVAFDHDAVLTDMIPVCRRCGDIPRDTSWADPDDEDPRCPTCGDGMGLRFEPREP